MTTQGTFALCLVLVIAAANCCDAGQAAAKDESKSVAEANNAFALDLYAKLKDAEGNLFFSPFSISTALAMTYAGARGNTAKQMAEVLHFDLPQESLHSALGALMSKLQAGKKDSGYQLSIANALWGQAGYEFLPSFLDLTNKNYGAGLREVDFRQTEKARKKINKWVEEQTNDKIKDLIKEGALGPQTLLVLTNAIYFLGDWAYQFEEDRTSDAPFALLAGDKVKVPMMRQTEDFKYMEGDDFKALELPYKNNELSMIIFLPNKPDGLPGFEKALTAERVATSIAKMGKEEVRVKLPKFKLTSEFLLVDTLKSMGMTDAFALPPADFSGMTGRKNLFIAKVIHKAFVDVNEKGTEAAAATGVVMELTAIPGEPKVFKADHPFLFLIRDNRTAGILFMGRVMDPAG